MVKPITLWLTRPEEYNTKYLAPLEKLGVFAQCVPLLSWRKKPLKAKILLQKRSVLVVVSPIAAKLIADILPHLGEEFLWVAPGETSFETLRQQGFRLQNCIKPKKMDGLGSIASKLLQRLGVQKRDIHFFKGTKGSQVLQSALKEAGHHIFEHELYQMVPNSISENLSKKTPDFVLVASLGALEAWNTLLEQNAFSHLKKSVLLVPSKKLLGKAEVFGFRGVCLNSLSPEALVLMLPSLCKL